MARHEITKEQREAWRNERVQINDLGDEVYLHLIVCRRCKHWFQAKYARSSRGACLKHRRRTGRAYSCEDFVCDGPRLIEMVMETLVQDGKLAARDTPLGRMYGLPNWTDKEWESRNDGV